MGGLGDLQAPEIVLCDFLGCRLPGVVPGVAPQLGLHPGHQFQRVEGFGDVVISPQGQPHDLVHILYTCRQHDNGKQVVLPDALAEGEPVHVRQHHIQDRQIKVLPLDAVQSVRAVVEFVDRVSLVFQIDLHQVRDGGLIVYYQNLSVHDKNLPQKLYPHCSISG